MSAAELYAPTLVYIGMLLVVGLVGNSVVFLVYYRQFEPSTIRLFILTMSVCDLLINVFSLAVEFALHLVYDVEFNQLCRVKSAVSSLLVLFSGFLVINTAIERYKKVCQPSQLYQRSSAKRAMVMCGFLAIVIATPYIVLSGRQTVHYPDLNRNGSVCNVDDKFLGSPFLQAYKVIAFITFPVCFVIMAASYALIGAHLWRHRQRQAAARGHNSASRKGQSSLSSSDKVNLSCSGPFFAAAGSTTLAVNESTGTRAKAHNIDIDQVVMRMIDENKHKDVDCCQAPTSRATCAEDQPKPEDNVEDVVAPAQRSLTDLEHVGQAPLRAATAPDVHSKLQAKKLPRRTTLMMFVITTVFMVNFLPYLLTIAIFSGNRSEGSRTLGLNLYNILQRSYYVNSAVNPVIYWFCSKRFRYQCWQLFPCKSPKS